MLIYPVHCRILAISFFSVFALFSTYLLILLLLILCRLHFPLVLYYENHRPSIFEHINCFIFKSRNGLKFRVSYIEVDDFASLNLKTESEQRKRCLVTANYRIAVSKRMKKRAKLFVVRIFSQNSIRLKFLKTCS